MQGIIQFELKHEINFGDLDRMASHTFKCDSHMNSSSQKISFHLGTLRNIILLKRLNLSKCLSNDESRHILIPSLYLQLYSSNMCSLHQRCVQNTSVEILQELYISSILLQVHHSNKHNQPNYIILKRINVYLRSLFCDVTTTYMLLSTRQQKYLEFLKSYHIIKPFHDNNL